MVSSVSTLDIFLWAVLPYVAITLFVVGHIYRYLRDGITWTSQSSEILEKNWLRWGSMLFHYGVILVLAGHFIGLIIPKSWHEAMGLSEGSYHLIAVLAGIPAGLITLVGLLILIARRSSIRRVLAITSFSDWVVLFVLLGTVIFGLLSTLSNIGGGFDYRENIAPWLRGILTLRPEPNLMAQVPMLFKIHIIFVMLLVAIWPFTRLVHVLSLPISFIWRNPIPMRQRCGDTD
jgi:nitrate reductase gamma subunit